MDTTELGLSIIAGVLSLPTLWILWVLIFNNAEPSDSYSPESVPEYPQTRTGHVDLGLATTDITDINWHQSYVGREIERVNCDLLNDNIGNNHQL